VRVRIGLVRATFGLWLITAGCSRDAGETGAAPVTGPVRGGTVVIAMAQEPETMMPYAHRSVASSTALSFIFRVLAETEANFLDFAPSVARSWEFSPDRKVLTMHLRDDVRWSDGVALTSEDVRFTWDVQRDSLVGWTSRHWKDSITDCEIVDPHTVRFHFSEVFRDQVRLVKEGFLLPKHLLEHVPRDTWASSDFGNNPIGCGPFKLERWEKGQRMVLVRNEHYFVPEQPYLDRIVLEFIPDAAVRVQQLRAGLVDVLPYDIDVREAAAMRADFEAGRSDVRVVSARGRTWDYIGYNPHDPLFADRRVREALTRAIDRKAIIDGLCYGFAELFESPVVPIMWAYDAERPVTPFDPEGAKRLLAEAGWSDSNADGLLDKDGRPFEFTIMTNKDNKLRVDALVPVQRDWRNVGVKAEIQTLEAAAARELREARKFQAFLGGWMTNIAVDFETVWGCSQVKTGRYNYVDYCNPRVDSLNAIGVSTLDPELAKPIFREAQRLVADDYPYTWLYYIHAMAGIQKRVQNVLVDARGPLINMEEWWVQDADTAAR
jgi:peptide/nickel transport system substrate-binding protein